MRNVKRLLLGALAPALFMLLSGCGQGSLTTKELDTEKIAVNFY